MTTLAAPVNTYTSTGMKLLRHPELLHYIRLTGTFRVQSLQLAITNRCNLKCSFCSVDERYVKEELGLTEILDALAEFKMLGAKTVEITGGGDPTMHPDLRSIIVAAKKGMGYKVGLITNGIKLEETAGDAVGLLDWLRISMNTMDYRPGWKPPKPPAGVTYGFSYCFGTDSTERTLRQVADIAREQGAEYVRLVPDCRPSGWSFEKQHADLERMAAEIGPPVFYQHKNKQGHPGGCWMGYLKPFLNCDGYVYPCSSTVLNPDAEKQFNPKYRLCHWRDFGALLCKGGTEPCWDSANCPDCVFGAQNAMLDYIVRPQAHEDFI